MPKHLIRSAFLTALVLAALAPAAGAAPATPGALRVGFPQVDTFPGFLSVADPVVADVGDIDGDGLEDTAVSVPAADGSETAWVTFADATTPSSVEAGQPGWRGIAITGAHVVDALEGAGDTNGDGVNDIAIDTGTVTYVVYGRRDGGAVDLRNLGTGGFTIANSWWPGGYGTGGPSGYAQIDSGSVDVGDQDGDGRADLAVMALPAGGGTLQIAIVRSPTTPGATVDATAPADQVLAYGWASNPRTVNFGSLGDIDGDGRQDLSIGWSTADAVHVAGVVSPAPGADVRLEAVAADHRGFLYNTAAPYDVRGFTTVGDQNGDGSRDTEIIAGRAGRAVNVLPTLPAGTEQTFSPDTSTFGMSGDAIVPIGDQDGDGREDVTDMTYIHGTRGGEDVAPARAGVLLVGAVADRNGDGRRELLGLHADPFNDPSWTGTGTATAKYQLDTYFGVPAPCCPASPSPPLQVPPARTPPVAREPRGKRITGTRKNDRLTGTAYDDVIKGMAGNDTIKGLAGNDVIDGGPGKDRIDAGAGNDRISARDGHADTIVCGAGRDVVVADRGDRVKGCEQVSRPRIKHKHKKKTTKAKRHR